MRQAHRFVGSSHLLCRQGDALVTSQVTRHLERLGCPSATVRDALADFDCIWDELFAAEQARLVRLLVEPVDARDDGVRLASRPKD